MLLALQRWIQFINAIHFLPELKQGSGNVQAAFKQLAFFDQTKSDNLSFR